MTSEPNSEMPTAMDSEKTTDLERLEKENERLEKENRRLEKENERLVDKSAATISDLKVKLDIASKDKNPPVASKVMGEIQDAIKSIVEKEGSTYAEKEQDLKRYVDEGFSLEGISGGTLYTMAVICKAGYLSLTASDNTGQALGFIASKYYNRGSLTLYKKFKRAAFIENDNCRLELLKEGLRGLDAGKDIVDAITIARLHRERDVRERRYKVVQEFGSLKDYVMKTCSVYYYPTVSYCRPKFIGQIVAGIKRRFLRGDVREFKAPDWPEVSATKCMDDWCCYPLILTAIPDRLKGEVTCDKDFFFSIVNTVYPDSMRYLFNTASLYRTRTNVQEEIEQDDPAFEKEREFAKKFDAAQKDIIDQNKLPAVKSPEKKFKVATVIASYHVSVAIKEATFELKYGSPYDKDKGKGKDKDKDKGKGKDKDKEEKDLESMKA